MKLTEIRELVHVGAPEAPYGVRALARCYDIDDLARLRVSGCQLARPVTWMAAGG